MSANPEKKPVVEKAIGLFNHQNTLKVIRDTHTDELVLALCGPIGCPLHEVSAKAKTILEDLFSYEVKIVSLSDFIEKHSTPEKPVEGSLKYKRIKDLIARGNSLRGTYGAGVLAELAIHEIALSRQQKKSKDGSESFKSNRVCHIVDSIKNQQELDVLRSVYQDVLYCIGVYSPLDFRVKRLEGEDMTKAEIHSLIDQDSGEEKETGQTVRDTFPQSDVFLRVDENTSQFMADKLTRFLHIVLGSEVKTPTAAETAMYMAASAAANSACLSRQVGAAITNGNGEIISVGWNEVPKFGGNVYQSEGNLTENDFRCINWLGGTCHNDQQKDKITDRLVSVLIDNEIISKENRAKAAGLIRNSKIKDLIEFSRSIHAEMHALIIGSQKAGAEIRGGKLYCTTYPCHSCARHLVVAGITEVVFLEPYKKSLATILHSDSITENENESKKVKIIPFDGVAPSRYLSLFSMKKDSRKQSGKLNLPSPKAAHVKLEMSLESFPVLEGVVVEGLLKKNIISPE